MILCLFSFLNSFSFFPSYSYGAQSFPSYSRDNHLREMQRRQSILDPTINSNHTHIGHSFIQYYESNSQKPENHLPIVQIKFKIYNIRHLNDVDGTVDVDFVLMLDWEDPSLSLLDDHVSHTGKDGQNQEDEDVDVKTYTDEELQMIEYDPSNHFWPRIEMLNIHSRHGSNNQDIGLTLPKRHRSKAHPYRVTITHHCVYTVCIVLDFRTFPNDEQVISLSVKSRAARGLNGNQGVEGSIQLTHPTLRVNGHELVPTVDSLQEWDISEMRAAVDPPMNESNRTDCYTMQILVIRDGSPMFWQGLFPCACIDLLSLTAFGSPMTHLKDREGTVITLFLTVMAFKYVLNQKLPSVRLF